MSREAASLVDFDLASDPLPLGKFETIGLDMNPSASEGRHVVQPAEATLARAEVALHMDEAFDITHLFDTLV